MALNCSNKPCGFVCLPLLHFGLACVVVHWIRTLRSDQTVRDDFNRLMAAPGMSFGSAFLCEVTFMKLTDNLGCDGAPLGKKGKGVKTRSSATASAKSADASERSTAVAKNAECLAHATRPGPCCCGGQTVCGWMFVFVCGSCFTQSNTG